MDDKIIMIFKRGAADAGVDIEVPADITAGELIYGPNEGFHLGINMENPEEVSFARRKPDCSGTRRAHSFGYRPPQRDDAVF